jgi:NAD-dependent deacetylase
MNLDATQEAVAKAAGLIRSARRGIALTGAGISTPSGIPDFRSPGSGLWTHFDPFEVASLAAFRSRPDRFYDWIRPLANQVLEAQPNPAHFALARLQQAGFLTSIITQNIDGLHQKAGSSGVFEVHGTINHLTCVSCFRQVETSESIQDLLAENTVPKCLQCGGVLKLDVILFDEELPFDTWVSAEEATRGCDLMLVLGSSLEVLPVSRLPFTAMENGARLIVVNFSETYIDGRADVVISGDVADVLPQIAEAIFVD